ncbi:MAG: hypothetical protein K5765_05480 [Clostridia bacterium]|nr:hypothetical protein [Clostridia bacterium]
MKEIGGYFEIDSYEKNKEFYKELISLNSARNSLVYLVRAKKIKKVYIPIYLCDSIYSVLDREKIAYEFYRINKQFLPIIDKTLLNDEYVFIVNYYGMLTNDSIINLKNQYKNIIIDNTHAFFQQPVEDVDTIYSCRKFFGVPDGAYLFSNCEKLENIPVDISDSRLSHLYGRRKYGASLFYNEFLKNEDNFYALDVKMMSNETHNLLKKIDYNKVRKIRRKNFIYLHKKICHYNNLNLIPESIIGPFAYPFFIENSTDLRKKLIDNKVYIPVLWGNVSGMGGYDEKYALNIIPIPCDQRYGKKDMKYIIDIIKKYMED